MMRQVVVSNASRPETEPVRAGYCEAFFCQLRGLTFRRSLNLEEGLLLVQKRDSRLGSAIHMLGVWIDLAVIWINTQGEVVDVRLAKRWRFAYAPSRAARFVLEISASRIQDFRTGDQVVIQ